MGRKKKTERDDEEKNIARHVRRQQSCQTTSWRTYNCHSSIVLQSCRATEAEPFLTNVLPSLNKYETGIIAHTRRKKADECSRSRSRSGHAQRDNEAQCIVHPSPHDEQAVICFYPVPFRSTVDPVCVIFSSSSLLLSSFCVSLPFLSSVSSVLPCRLLTSCL